MRKVDEAVESPESGWVDSSHRFATDQTMALTRWVDSFFGDVEGDAETAESAELRSALNGTSASRIKIVPRLAEKLICLDSQTGSISSLEAMTSMN